MERSQHVLAFWGGGGRKRREEEERFFSKQPVACHSHLGKDKLRAVWVGQQTEKCLSGTWKQAIWSEGPRDGTWGQSLWGWGWWGGQWVGQIPKLSPPCPVSRLQRVKSLQTNSMGKTARRNDKGVCELRRFPPIRLGRAVEGLPLPYLDFCWVNHRLN